VSAILPLARDNPFVHCVIMVKRSKIRAYCNAIAREFLPEKIILFGSYAHGNPTDNSDVDLLVVMPRTRQGGERMAVRIMQSIPRDFALDLIVRTPSHVAKRLQWGDPFMSELMEQGKILYEANDA
jgi:predicted nucleotidyltransferase